MIKYSHENFSISQMIGVEHFCSHKIEKKRIYFVLGRHDNVLYWVCYAIFRVFFRAERNEERESFNAEIGWLTTISYTTHMGIINFWSLLLCLCLIVLHFFPHSSLFLLWKQCQFHSLSSFFVSIIWWDTKCKWISILSFFIDE